MHYGTGPVDITQVEQDPYIVRDYLDEIEMCHKSSKSVFFLVSVSKNQLLILYEAQYFRQALIGDSVGRMCLPTHIDEDIFIAISAESSTTSEERMLLNKWYTRSEVVPNGRKGRYILKQDYR